VGCDDLERELTDSSLGRDVESPNQGGAEAAPLAKFHVGACEGGTTTTTTGLNLSSPSPQYNAKNSRFLTRNLLPDYNIVSQFWTFLSANNPHVRIRRKLDGHPLKHLQSVAFETHHLARIICGQKSPNWDTCCSRE